MLAPVDKALVHGAALLGAKTQPGCLLHTPAVRMLREELQLLQEPGSYVGEVIKVSPFS